MTKKQIKKRFTLTITLLTYSLIIAQSNLNLRKAIQNSELIIEINDYQYNNVWVNDYIQKTFIQMDKIDTTNAIIYRNKLSSVPKRLTLRKFKDNEDFYSDHSVNQDCGCLGKALELDKSYSYLFFIKKVKNEYQILMQLYGLEYEQIQNYKYQIETINSFEKIKDEKERFSKTLDWFIENALLPDNDFIEYYKAKGITTDTIQYSEKQYEKILQQFTNGKEDLLPIIRNKYFDETKKYYVKKMEDILKMDTYEYGDYYDFEKAFIAISGDSLSYGSGDYILNYSLTSDKFDKYDKNYIMQHLLEVAKDWKN